MGRHAEEGLAEEDSPLEGDRVRGRGSGRGGGRGGGGVERARVGHWCCDIAPHKGLHSLTVRRREGQTGVTRRGSISIRKEAPEQSRTSRHAVNLTD